VSLFRRLVARADESEVVELPALRRPAKQERVSESGEVGLAKEARYHRDREEQE